MTTPASTPDAGTCPVTGPSLTDPEQIVQLYEDFFTDPRTTYRQMHRDGRSVVPVAMGPGQGTATVVIGFNHAREILDDSLHYPTHPKKDQPRRGERRDHQDLAQAVGAQHVRLRSVIRESLAHIDQHALRSTVDHAASGLIASFCGHGSADLVSEFAIPVAVHVFSWMLGLPPDRQDEAAQAVWELRTAEDTTPLTTLAWSAVEAARMTPSTDVISRLCQHSENLDDHEVVQQVVLLYSSGCLPTIDLIGNALMLVMTDQRFGEAVLCGSLGLRDALDRVLTVEPPRPILRPRFPTSLQIRDGVLLPPHHPVLVSPAGCAADPVMAATHARQVGNRSHLGWGGGEHKCPDEAAALAMLTAEEALGLLFESLPDMRLAPDARIGWLPNLYHRALYGLPVVFEPTSPLPHP
ncbi:hypothetical protein C5E45_20420 [Nocardia nova]|uniref:Cytochrome P450 n=1 Tax=Nocardia nova TaxID=37330 RepID=A0A2S6AMF4_9NOCA|nr:cytochrome P450 [Nocardia nova]PPJ36415.1 hypothetical protein C5E45_20420 [Nocardia nova]